MSADVDAVFSGGSLPELGPRARPGVEALAAAEAQGTELAHRLGLKGSRATCLQALVLLWHDHLDPAHALVQDLPGPDAAFVHGIIHRREPDYSNARYWFHRVGDHPVLEPLADDAAPVLAAHAALPQRLIREGRWDPLAFIDAVSAVERGPSVPEVRQLLLELQRLELRCLARVLAAS